MGVSCEIAMIAGRARFVLSNAHTKIPANVRLGRMLGGGGLSETEHTQVHLRVQSLDHPFVEIVYECFWG